MRFWRQTMHCLGVLLLMMRIFIRHSNTNSSKNYGIILNCGNRIIYQSFTGGESSPSVKGG